MSLVAQIRVPERNVEVSLQVPAGSTTAVIGPNGSGKSTMLGAIAGIIDGHAQRIVLDGRTLDGDGVRVPPHRRGTALLAQDPRLFPRMTVLDNVAFPARARGLSRRDAHAHALALLRSVEAPDLGPRRPSQLSGGQAQRVALARALAAQPRLLLLDEPLAALDQPVAAAVRHTLAGILAARTSILVTHEILDAALLADHLVVVEGGRVIEQGATAEVMRRPRTAFAARLCGLNLLAGTSRTTGSVDTDAGTVQGMGTLRPGESAAAVFAPASVAVYRQDPGGSPRNMFVRHVIALEPQGGLIRVRTTDLAADLTPAAVAAMALRPGERVVLTVKAAEVELYPVTPKGR